MKPVANIFGNIRKVPSLGERVIIFVNGLPFCYTSSVVKIHNQTEDGIEFETQNTMYNIEYDKQQEISTVAW